MGFEIRPLLDTVKVTTDEVVSIDKNLRRIFIKTDSERSFALVVSMTCESYQNRIKHKLIVPDVYDYQEAYAKAKSKFKLSGEWATNVGVTLFYSNTDFDIPSDWKDCEVQFENY